MNQLWQEMCPTYHTNINGLIIQGEHALEKDARLLTSSSTKHGINCLFVFFSFLTLLRLLTFIIFYNETINNKANNNDSPVHS